MPRRTTRQTARKPVRTYTKKPARKLNLKRVLMFIMLLISLFLASFFMAGGAGIFGPHTVDNLSQTFTNNHEIEKLERAMGEEADRQLDKAAERAAELSEEETTPSTWTRVGRVLFLKNAVNKKIKATNNYVTIDKIPEALQQAVVSVEDGHFYEHIGFDVSGIARAALVNLQYGEVKEGASTITQQLVKNMFLSQEQSFGRKAEELLLAIDMEMNYSKEEILEMYLNSIYFGSGYYGISEAADGYFAKKPSELSLSEASMLAGVPNAPSLYSPYVDFILAKKRQIIVLDAMVRNGYLRENVAEDAKIRPIYLAH